MSYLTQYRKSDFRRMSWQEYGKTLDDLYKKISSYLKANKIKIDAIVPILRGGAFPGTYLAFRLGMLTILPVQYKYFFNGKKLQLRKLRSFANSEVKAKKPTFLLVENNHCFGVTAATAAKDLGKQFPGCRIIYAADYMDYPYRKAVKASASFFGRYTNETRGLTPAECKRLRILNVSNVFPWESVEEEWTTVSGKQYKYKDLSQSVGSSRLKKEITL